MLQQLLQSVAPRQFYETVLGRSLPQENARGDVKINCVFHESRTGRRDDSASLSINLNPELAGKYNCFGGTCGAGGTIIKFYQEYREIHGVSINNRMCRGPVQLRQVAAELVELFKLDPDTLEKALIDDKTLVGWSNELLNSGDGQTLLQHILTNRCLTKEIVYGFRLGMNDAGRLTIPILDTSDTVVNVRQWLPEYLRITEAQKRAKIISLPGVGQPRLFPIRSLKDQFIILCEGEMDALALHSLGLNAITSTGGAGSFEKAWITLFQDKDVVLMLDTDYAGQQATDRLLTELYDVVRSIKAVDLTFGEDVKDVTDYVVKHGVEQAGRALRELIGATPSFYLKDDAHPEYNAVNLFQAGTKEMIGRRIKVPARIAGKDPQAFAVPKRIRCICTASKASQSCPGCPRATHDEAAYDRILDLDSADIVKLVQSGNAQQVIKNIFNITCRTCKFELEEYETVEEVQLIPDTDTRATGTYEYSVRNAYIVGYGAKLNLPYELHGRTIVDDSARVTHVFNRADLVNKTGMDVSPDARVVIDELEQTVADHLKEFQIGTLTVNEKLAEIYGNLEAHVTRIIQRRDVIQTLDMTYHSPLSFMFGDKPMYRGWMSALILGDSQCGKSETAIQLQAHYGLGEMYSGEGLTRAGIVGAYAELPGKRGVQFRLGVAPLNDGGLLIIDEAGGLSQEQFDELTMLRSTGEAISTKYGQHNRFPARIRLIMIANPRGSGPGHRSRSMSSYQFGCQAVKELVGGDADIARFDLFCNVASDEVRYEDINAPISIVSPLKYTSDLCRLLLLWVWSRRTSDWVFSEDAQKLILEHATKMSETYDPSIPIVAGGSQRWTIARAAASIAARVYSTDNGYCVLVNVEHVEAALKYLYNSYNKQCMMYHLYSARQKAGDEILDKAALVKLLDTYPYTLWSALREVAGKFTVRDLIDSSGIDDFSVRKLMPQLKVLRVVFQSGSYWYTTPGFKRFAHSGQFTHHDEANSFNTIMGEPEVEGDASITH